ncbi:MAG TPA: membrane protein insertion efficiency factor YidD [Bacteroidia bacterium]|nr:membrane protein insertion efficiency factor YidD [Bacteroidia bacterium]
MLKILIFITRCYQNISPKSIRSLCRYTPTCSEYMILSLKKYGVRKGVRKGMIRFKNCKYPNGGIDYP